jgi:hypothetical protein
MLPRLTFDNVATPDAFVVALPTPLPFNVKLIVLPLIAVVPDFNVAERLTVPP